MYEYPTYSGNTIGSLLKPREISIPSTTPIAQGSSVTAGMYDGFLDSPAANTVGDIYKAAAVPTTSVGEVVDKPSAGDIAKNGLGEMSFGEKLGAAGDLAVNVFGAYNAYKANKLAKEQFNFSKMNTNRNFRAQANITNSQLADRQAARVARDPKQFSSVNDYMKKYGVKV